MRCGLLGEKLGHSYSPAIHAQLADYAYGLYEVAPKALPAFLTGGDFDALNVTIPYKKAVIPYCTELSPIARRLGSVNVLVRRADGTLYGDNADAFGFEYLVRRSGIDVAGQKALSARQRRRVRDHSGRARAARRARDGHLPPRAG
ncbi:MAG: shikimate dehydrogenase family protein [Oscillospiraceae bacterium]